ncbi:MAG: hypothetical protein CMJ39_08125 [Phycisphaerae bacterium]|nr:hypothetical protein [Phycisphaerae bacterium]
MVWSSTTAPSSFSEIDLPKAPRFLASVVDALHHDLRFAPDDTKLRQMNAAEELIGRVKPEQLYPMDFVVYRVTGYRPETTDFDTTLVGKALIRDLCIFVQTLSAEIDLPMQSERGLAIPLDQVAARLGITRRTIQRRRADGLVLHWVRDESGRRFVGCFPDSMDRFLESCPVNMGSRWRRVDQEERAELLSAARLLHESTGQSLDAVAGELAARFGRSRSTVRRVLRADDRQNDTPLFDTHGPLTSRDACVCIRAREMGIPVTSCAERFGKSSSALHRAMLRERVSRLQALPLRWSVLPTFNRPDADQVLLGLDVVERGLPGPDLVVDIREPLASCSEADRERMVVASHWLLARASSVLLELDQQPDASQVDAVESDLRWAGRLRGAIVRQGLPAAFQACEHSLGRPVWGLPREEARRWYQRCLQACWEVVDALEPRLSSRLESRCIAAMDRLLATRKPASRPRAAARHDSDQLQFAWMHRQLVMWPWLEPDHHWISRRSRLQKADHDLITERWGCDGLRPLRVQELVRKHGGTSTAMQRKLHGLEVQLRMNRLS